MPIPEYIVLITLTKEKCRKHRVCGTFGVFRFLLSRGTIVHLPSQENEIQNLSQQPIACRKHFVDMLKAVLNERLFISNALKFLCCFVLFVRVHIRLPLFGKPIRIVLVLFVVPYLRIMHLFVFGNIGVRLNIAFNFNA